MEHAGRLLHVLYALGVAWTVRSESKRIRLLVPAHVAWFVIGVCLILDNVRIALSGSVDEEAACLLSKLCFFSHEALTPLGLLFVPAIYLKHTLRRAKDVILATQVAFSGAGCYLAVLGAQRFITMLNGLWKLEENALGLKVCRPKLSHPMSALFPIFATILSVIGLAVYLLQFENRPSFRKEDDGKDDKIVASGRRRVLSTLLFSQIIVFVGNGAIGPNRVLMGLVGNAFEMLWLWGLGVGLF
jgi:hypothetical protein